MELDGDAAHRDLRDNVAAKTQLGALAFQQFRSALVLVAEAVVMTGHQMDGVIPLMRISVTKSSQEVVIISLLKGTMMTSSMS